MIILSDFSECLKDLMFDRGIDAGKLAKELGLHENSVYRYLSGSILPTLETALKLADFFGCSIEYLLGRTQSNNARERKPLPQFSQQLRFLFEYFNSNEYRLHKSTKISRSITYAWLNHSAIPSLENLAKIADHFDCTIDFVIGIES